MVTRDERQKHVQAQIENVSAHLDFISANSAKLRRADLALSSFEEWESVFVELDELISALRNLNAEMYPWWLYVSLATPLENIRNACMSFIDFSGTPDQRHTLVSSLEKALDPLMDAAVPLLAWADHVDSPRAKEQAAILENMRTMHVDAKETLLAVKALVPAKSVSTAAAVFTESAGRFDRSAAGWLKAIFGAVFVFGVGVAYWFSSANVPDAPGQIVAWAVVRAAVLSGLTYIIAMLARNYRACQHNSVTYRHRALALETFEPLLSGTMEPGIRDTILLHAAQAIFAPQVSGYVNKEADPSPHNTVVEIMRAAKEG